MEILSFDVPVWTLVVLALSTYLIYMVWHFRVFKQMGVPGPTPFPIVGTFIMQGKMGVMETDTHCMKKYGKIWGLFDGRLPSLVIADEDMVKEILVKKFANFSDKLIFKGLNGDLEHSVLFASGDYWRNSRNLLTPTFSAGKLKKMTPLITKAAGNMIDGLKENQNRELNVKQVYGAYTMDVIASTAFGMDVNSQKDPNDPLVKNAAKLFDISLKSPIVVLLLFMPFVLTVAKSIFDICFFPKDAQKYFRRIVVDEINKRKQEREDYIDFMQLMIKAHDESPGETKKGMSFEEILGNSLVFFFAGYETTATTLSLLSHNLALYPEIQDKVYEEIQRELGDDLPDYDNIQKLPYLDMCINETLRLFPPLARTNRLCTSEVEIKGLTIPKGMNVHIPIWAIHHSPDIWQDPETFDPERFSPENKVKYLPSQFLPFGYGPRNCIGMRLALLELKFVFVRTIRQFKFSVGEKTQIPPKLNDTGLISPKEVWLNVQER